jgi:RNA polymerase sigma factor (sigma-70 family)
MLVLARPGPPSLDLDSITDPDERPNPLAHMKLVWSIAIAYHGCGRRRGLDLEDLVQSGHIGLLRACKEFRPELGYKFSTYANYWIEHFIGRALQNAHGPLRVPVGLLDLMSAVRREKVKEDDLTGKQKSRIADAERLLGSAVIHDPAVLADVVADRCQDEGRGEDAELARSLLGILPAREREVIAAHFGIGGGDPLPLAEVGARAGLSRSEAETAYRRGLKRIRSYLVARGFMEARRRPPSTRWGGGFWGSTDMRMCQQGGMREHELGPTPGSVAVRDARSVHRRRGPARRAGRMEGGRLGRAGGRGLAREIQLRAADDVAAVRRRGRDDRMGYGAVGRVELRACADPDRPLRVRRASFRDPQAPGKLRVPDEGDDRVCQAPGGTIARSRIAP